MGSYIIEQMYQNKIQRTVQEIEQLIEDYETIPFDQHFNYHDHIVCGLREALDIIKKNFY